MNLTLFRRREVWLPTWRGLLVLLLLLGGLSVGLFKATYPFLAIHNPQSGGILVLEGWVNHSVIPVAVGEYRARGYAGFYVTGGPIDRESPLAFHGTYAVSGATRLHELGVAEAVPVPSEWVEKDRTYTSARDLRHWLQAHGGVPTQVTVFTSPAHARRTRMLYQKAFGSETKIGILPAPQWSYDAQRWWASSMGAREVLGEAIAYLYARLFFWPKADAH